MRESTKLLRGQNDHNIGSVSIYTITINTRVEHRTQPSESLGICYNHPAVAVFSPLLKHFPIIEHLLQISQSINATKSTKRQEPLHHPISLKPETEIVMATVVEASSEATATVAEKAPVTAHRKVPQDLETKLPKPCN